MASTRSTKEKPKEPAAPKAKRRKTRVSGALADAPSPGPPAEVVAATPRRRAPDAKKTPAAAKRKVKAAIAKKPEAVAAAAKPPTKKAKPARARQPRVTKKPTVGVAPPAALPMEAQPSALPSAELPQLEPRPAAMQPVAAPQETTLPVFESLELSALPAELPAIPAENLAALGAPLPPPRSDNRPQSPFPQTHPNRPERTGPSRRRRRRGSRRSGAAAALDAPPTGDESTHRAHIAARRLGIDRLYPEQDRTIRAAMAGRDVLVVQPTGFGKSACYQVPSMVLPRPVVLVSPLLALLRDQQEKLTKRNIPVERIDGTVRGVARREALQRVAAGGSLLVMTTPETLAGDELGAALQTSGIALAAVDEAHCISEWGHDFRPAYMRLGERLRELGKPPVLALTATATQSVRDDIVRYLGMRDPEVVASSPHRANLAFEVMQIGGASRARAMTRFIKRLQRPGIIYCATTKAVDDIYGALRLLRLPVHRYHGRMAGKDRNSEQEMYMRPKRRTIMVATSAFGLGIDKPDIRYIVHYQAPASLEQYVQEAGRAGRDGRKANCVLLFDPGDREVHEALQQTSRIRPDQLYRISSALVAYAGEGRQPNLEGLTLAAQLGDRQTQALLVVLEEAGLVVMEDDTVRITVPASEFEEQARSLAGRFLTLRTQDGRRLDRMGEYVNAKECRAIFLRRYFGEADGNQCGLCDICRGAKERPSTFWQPIARPEPRRRKRKRRRRGRHGGGAPQGQQGQPIQPNAPPTAAVAEE